MDTTLVFIGLIIFILFAGGIGLYFYFSIESASSGSKKSTSGSSSSGSGGNSFAGAEYRCKDGSLFGTITIHKDGSSSFCNEIGKDPIKHKESRFEISTDEFCYQGKACKKGCCGELRLVNGVMKGNCTCENCGLLNPDHEKSGDVEGCSVYLENIKKMIQLYDDYVVEYERVINLPEDQVINCKDGTLLGQTKYIGDEVVRCLFPNSDPQRTPKDVTLSESTDNGCSYTIDKSTQNITNKKKCKTGCCQVTSTAEGDGIVNVTGTCNCDCKMGDSELNSDNVQNCAPYLIEKMKDYKTRVGDSFIRLKALKNNFQGLYSLHNEYKRQGNQIVVR